MTAIPVVYAGSFDPVTNGHIDIARRAREVFGNVVVLLIANGNKRSLFSEDERFALLQQTFKDEPGIRVDRACGLLTDYLKERGLRVLVRGVRGPEDVAHEMTNAHYNKKFFPLAETVLLPCRAEYAFLSSSAVREAFGYGADVSDLVPPCVAEALAKKRGG